MVSTISIPLPIIDQVNQHSIEGAIMEMQPANNITRPISITTVGNPRLTPTQTVLKNKRSIRRLVITLKTILVLLGHPLLIIRISPPPNLGMIAITSLINITLPPLPSESRKTKASVYTDHYSHHPGANYSNPEYECQYPPEPMHPIAHRNDANNNSAEINATYSHEESRGEYNEYNMPPPLPAPDFNDGPDFDPPSSSTGSGGYIVKL